MSGKKGFTLIELLIVVAIIGILVAISIPNFLLAQLRAKVARQVTEFRTMTITLEAYAVDQTNYPPPSHLYTSADYFTPCPFPMGRVPGRITTPVAYITQVPNDIFSGGRLFYTENHWNTTQVCVGSRYTFVDALYNMIFWEEMKTKHAFKYTLVSWGPDKKYQTDMDCSPWSMRWPDGSWYTVGYDPSNGTMSSGDIHWFGPGSLSSVTEPGG